MARRVGTPKCCDVLRRQRPPRWGRGRTAAPTWCPCTSLAPNRKYRRVDQSSHVLHRLIQPGLAGGEPLLGAGRVDHAVERARRLPATRSAEVRNQHSKWSSRTPVVVGQEGGEDRLLLDAEAVQRRDLRRVTEHQPGPGLLAQRDVGRAREVDGRLHQHAAEGAVVDRAELRAAAAVARRPLDLDARTELAVDVVLAGRPVSADREVEVGLVLGHAPDALAALDRDLAAHRQVDHELAGAVACFRSRPGSSGGAGLRAVGARRWRASTRRTCRCR